MTYEIVQLQEKTLVGMAIHTGNADPDVGSKIGGLWDNFFAEEVYSKIKNRQGRPLCLYSDYTDTNVDSEGLSYQVTLGYDVMQNENSEYVAKTIPAGQYAKFMVHGNVATDVAAAWQQIWQLPLDRSYTGDFEEYLNDSMDDAEVAIYIALK